LNLEFEFGIWNWNLEFGKNDFLRVRPRSVWRSESTVEKPKLDTPQLWLSLAETHPHMVLWDSTAGFDTRFDADLGRTLCSALFLSTTGPFGCRSSLLSPRRAGGPNSTGVLSDLILVVLKNESKMRQEFPKKRRFSLSFSFFSINKSTNQKINLRKVPHQ
jgi:hypothetical protein